MMSAPAATIDTDLEAITATALDYIEGWYDSTPERTERCLHPQLAKRRIVENAQTGASEVEQMSAQTLIDMVRGKPAQQEASLIKDVQVLDVWGDLASVKVEMNDWVDYLHMARVEGRWVIMDALWALKAREQ